MLSHYLYSLNHNLRARLLRQRRPLLAGVKLTHRCNLRCPACPFWRRPAPDIGYVQALAALDALHAAGVRLVIFEGGEPLLWRDGEHTVEDLVRVARTRFFAVGITTNGTLPLTTSADMVWVSIDGPREVHDAYRGPSYDRIMANIAASGHRRVMANVTINRLNCARIPELLRDLTGRVRGVTIQFAYPYGDGEDLTVDPEARRRVLDELVALKRAGYPLLDSYGALRRLKGNTWRCHDWLIANVEPDGRINLGCYLKGRGAVDCRKCGFAAHAELSRAFDWDPAAILCGRAVFGF
ncbi:MAG TPA: radical SAM protein [Anaerolineae bacterium]|nr:radical SAM protein [Anaerolineae bacterium]